MSRDNAHPALHTPMLDMDEHGDMVHVHIVPEGWEDLDRGICPCGEVVVWKSDGTPDDGLQDGEWVPDRTLRVLVLTNEEAHHLFTGTADHLRRQIVLQDEIASYENDGI